MESIRVAVRIRPDEDSFDESCLVIDESNRKLKIVKRFDGTSRSEMSDYAFDNIYGPSTSQETIFHDVRNLIDESLKGFNVTVFAFGMTGSGKTHTIAGNHHNPGIVPRTVNHIFSDLQQKSNKSKDKMSMVFLSYVELYNNSLYDLLASELPNGDENTSGLKLHEHPTKGMQISGSRTLRTPVASADQALRLISQGNKLRSTSSTNLNERSSRSHTVISFEIVSQDNDSITNSAKIGKINLVDLAGSERVKLSGAEGQAMEEAKQINKALSVLGDVLNSLSKYHQGLSSIKSETGLKKKNMIPLPHIPFRNSKLTMLLKDSLGGNAKTMMIATIRSSSTFYQQSVMSLKYATRAQFIKCSPIQNITNNNDNNDGSASSIMQETLLEVNRLKIQLNNRNEEANILQSRLLELEKFRKISDTLGLEFSEETKQRLEKENKYKEKINKLQNQSIKEKKELEEHLRCVIHNHEDKIAEKEKVYIHLENQLAVQTSQIFTLNNESKEAIKSKERTEITNSQLIINLNDNEILIKQLIIENDIKSKKLKDYQISLNNSIENQKEIQKENQKEIQNLNTKIQEVILSRDKYIGLSEEYKINFEEIDINFTQYKARTEGHRQELDLNKNQERSDYVIAELKKTLQDYKEKLDYDVIVIQRIEKEKKDELIKNETNRIEIDLLMENVVSLDSEWNREILRNSEEKKIREEKIQKLKNKIRIEETEKNRFKNEIQDYIKIEKNLRISYDDVILKNRNLEFENLRFQEMESLSSEKSRNLLLDNSSFQKHILENKEKLHKLQSEFEKQKCCNEESLFEARKEYLKEKNEYLEISKKEKLSLENEIIELNLNAKSQKSIDDEKTKKFNDAIEKTKKEFLDDLLTSQKKSFQIEKDFLQKNHVEVEVNLERKIESLNLQLIELRKDQESLIENFETKLNNQNYEKEEMEKKFIKEKNDFHDIVDKLQKKIINNENENKEMLELKQVETDSLISSLKKDFENLQENSLETLKTKESEEKEKISFLKRENLIVITDFTEKLRKAEIDLIFQKEKIIEVENKNKIEKNDNEKKKLKDEEENVKERFEIEKKKIEEKEKENEILKNRISMMILQEKEMFSSLKGRLSDLDDARSKLLKLQQSKSINEKSDLQLFLFAEQQEAQINLEEKYLNIQIKSISLEGELKKSKDANKELRLELEKKSKQLALEQQKCKSYSSDVNRIRKSTSEELKNTVFMVRQRVEKIQDRRFSEISFNSLNLTRDSNEEESMLSFDQLNNLAVVRSNSLYSTDTFDTLPSVPEGEDRDQLVTFDDFMNLKHGISEESE